MISASKAFTSASFSIINKKTQKPEIYSTLDTSWNVMTFTIENTTGADLALTGGKPVKAAHTGTASSFAFDFRGILTDAQAEAMSVVDERKEWGALFFPSGAHTNPTWAVAPLKDLVFKNGEKIVFTLDKIACTSQTPSYFEVLYFNIPGISDRSFPFTYLIAVLNPPVGADLKQSLHNGILNKSVLHIIRGQSPPPPGGNGPPPVAVDITYDNIFPIQNGFTIYLKNISGGPLLPAGTPLGGAVFTISFLFGTGEADAITSQALGDGITIDVDSEHSQWSTSAHQQDSANWVISPLSSQLMFADETVKFVIGNIITELDSQPDKISSLHIQWNFIPNYADGYYSVEMQKQTAIPGIPSLTIEPDRIDLGGNVRINYQTEVAAYITLEYVRRDGSQVTLVSPTDITYNETDFSPKIPPDKEDTVFTLSVYYGPGQKAVFQRTVPITVIQPPATISSFTASSMLVNINADNQITLNWQVENAKTVAVVGYGIQTGNSLPVTVNATTTYTLRATPWGSDGQTVEATVTVYAYKAYPPVAVGPLGDGTAFQSLPLSITNHRQRVIYVSNAAGGGSIYQVSQDNHVVLPTVFPGNIMALSADESRLFVEQLIPSSSGRLWMYDTANPATVSSVPTAMPAPYSLAVNPAAPATLLYYLQQHYLTTVSVYSVNEAANTLAYVKDIGVGQSPEAYAFDAAGKTLYVGNYDTSNVSVIDVGQNTLVTNIPLQSSEPCAFALVGTTLFVACSGGDQVCVIDTTTNTTKTPLTAGDRPFSLTLDQNKKRLFVTNFQGNTVTVIDTGTLATSTIPVGNGPSAIKITESGNLMFVSNYCDKSLTVVDISNGGALVVGTIALESTNGNPIDISTYGTNNNYTDVFVAKEYFKARNGACQGSTATDPYLNMSIFSIQEKASTKKAHSSLSVFTGWWGRFTLWLRRRVG